MKYENFAQAKELVTRINEHKDLIKELNGNFVMVRVLDSNYDSIMTIGAAKDYEHEAVELALTFKKTLIVFYEERLASLLDKLSEL